MELKFDQELMECLADLDVQPRQQEQTQEVRLTEGMPDIGRILGCWGHPVIRGKEWRSDSVGVSGGIMAWVLYMPEDGSVPQTVEAWIPFQTRWEIPQTDRDGVITASAYIRSMDARVTSARKMMVRCTLQMAADVQVPMQCHISKPSHLPKDVQLLQETYPLELLEEAGERQVSLEESMDLPSSYPAVKDIVRLNLQTRITEHKLLGSRLVFRGICYVKLVYLAEEGSVHSWDLEVPISQFADLQQEYGAGADAEFTVVTTGLELDRGEGNGLQLKAAVCVQYRIFARHVLQVVEDAYCPGRELKQEIQQLLLPVRLDTRKERLDYSHMLRGDGQQITDHCTFGIVDTVRQVGDEAQTVVQLVHQVVYPDAEGQLQSASSRNELQWQLPSDTKNRIRVEIEELSCKANISDQIHMIGSCDLRCRVYGMTQLPMVTAITVGEAVKPDFERPSLILKKTGNRRLWDIAKECGSTVDAICKANQLEQEPEQDRMLLIPVL